MSEFYEDSAEEAYNMTDSYQIEVGFSSDDDSDDNEYPVVLTPRSPTSSAVEADLEASCDYSDSSSIYTPSSSSVSTNNEPAPGPSVQVVELENNDLPRAAVTFRSLLQQHHHTFTTAAVITLHALTTAHLNNRITALEQTVASLQTAEAEAAAAAGSPQHIQANSAKGHLLVVIVAVVGQALLGGAVIVVLAVVKGLIVRWVDGMPPMWRTVMMAPEEKEEEYDEDNGFVGEDKLEASFEASVVDSEQVDEDDDDEDLDPNMWDTSPSPYDFFQTMVTRTRTFDRLRRQIKGLLLVPNIPRKDGDCARDS